MFGFKRKAREREEALDHITYAVHVQLCAELQEIATQALSETHEPTDRKYVLSNAEAIRRGIDAVLAEGVDAYGPEMKMEDRPTQCGAVLADAARNMAVISGSLNNSGTRGDISFGLGFERDAFGG